MATLNVGDAAPSIHLQSSDGKAFTLKNHKNQHNVVIYFYPKDDTPGCTTEACGFRDVHAKIKKTSSIIVGISPDNLGKHQKFIEKFQLPFLLLYDEDKTICQKYGVWVEKSMYGRKYMGVARTTFIIDKTGTIVKIFDKVQPKGHDTEVLAFLKTIA